MELPKVAELKKIIKFCRENGINSLKHGEFEVTLSSAAHFPEAKTFDSDAPIIEERKFSEEEILLWSAGVPIPEDAGRELT